MNKFTFRSECIHDVHVLLDKIGLGSNNSYEVKITPQVIPKDNLVAANVSVQLSTPFNQIELKNILKSLAKDYDGMDYILDELE